MLVIEITSSQIGSLYDRQSIIYILLTVSVSSVWLVLETHICLWFNVQELKLLVWYFNLFTNIISKSKWKMIDFPRPGQHQSRMVSIQVIDFLSNCHFQHYRDDIGLALHFIVFWSLSSPPPQSAGIISSFSNFSSFSSQVCVPQLCVFYPLYWHHNYSTDSEVFRKVFEDMIITWLCDQTGW